MGGKISICLIENYSLGHELLKYNLRKENDFEIVYEFSTIDECLKECTETCIDVIVTEMEISYFNTINKIRRIKEKLGNETKIIIYTTCCNKRIMEDYMLSGVVDDYILKDEGFNVVKNVIRSVLNTPKQYHFLNN